MTGKHLLANVYVSDIDTLSTVEKISPLMEQIINEMKLNVIGKLHKQFEPRGVTMLYLIAESHLSIHTFPEKNYCTIDLYCCNPTIDMNDVLDIIYRFFNGNCKIEKQVICR